MHLSSLRWSPRELIKDFPLEPMKDGDVFLFNDQFRGGIHSNDIMVFKPVFSGGKPRFLTSALIHVADLGGLSAGGFPATATEYFHEGLMLPPVKLYDGGRLNQDLVRIISANSRTPEKVMGDIRSMVGGTNVGAKRLLELIDKYGLTELEELVSELIDYTERLTRSEIAKIPRAPTMVPTRSRKTASFPTRPIPCGSRLRSKGRIVISISPARIRRLAEQSTPPFRNLFPA